MKQQKFNILDNSNLKLVRSDQFNFNFCKKTGFTQIWGATKEEDVVVCPAPLIADIEISTICSGVNGVLLLMKAMSD